MTKNVRTSYGFLKLVLGMCFLVYTTACSTAANDSLFSDAKLDVCPPGCTDTLVADDSQIGIKMMNSTITMASTDTRVDVGGDCYASLYTTNRIYVTVYDSTSTYTATAYGVNSSGTTLYCNNGRFDIAVDMSGIPAHGNFTVQATLVAYDSANAAHTNSSDGISYVSVRR